jgi:hypothetical protein
MWRMILVTVLFLGYAFYQISGGSDFEPRLLEVERTSHSASEEHSSLIPPQVPKTMANSAVASKEPDFLPQGLLEAASDSPLTQSSQPQPSQALTQTQTASRLKAGLQRGLTLSATDPLQNNLIQRRADQPDNAIDQRHITGVRARLRTGPGTNFPVLHRLNLGQKVVILESAGASWLRLKTLHGNHIGWVSGTVVSKQGD